MALKSGEGTIKPPKANNRHTFKAGDKVICVRSHSPAYKEGREYEVYTNENGWKCMRGDDGLEDVVSMLVSVFRKVGED